MLILSQHCKLNVWPVHPQVQEEVQLSSMKIQVLIMVRVVNIAVLVLLPVLSAILLEYWHDYCRYFSFVVSKWVSVFQLFFGNIRYQYFFQQATPLRLLHNDTRGTTTRVSVLTHTRCTVQGDVNYMRWTHVLGFVFCADGRTGVKTLTTDSETFAFNALKPNHELQFS